MPNLAPIVPNVWGLSILPINYSQALRWLADASVIQLHPIFSAVIFKCMLNMCMLQ